MNQGPRWVLLMKKTGGGKSRAPVPLRRRGSVNENPPISLGFRYAYDQIAFSETDLKKAAERSWNFDTGKRK